jgi:murein L,D-transpeptidase YcbB/YkuD
MDMAKFIVERDSNDKITVDTVQAWSDRRIERRVYLKKPFKVYIQYFTAEGDSSGIRFHRDIYGRDEDLRSNLKAFIKESQNRAQTL